VDLDVTEQGSQIRLAVAGVDILTGPLQHGVKPGNEIWMVEDRQMDRLAEWYESVEPSSSSADRCARTINSTNRSDGKRWNSDDQRPAPTVIVPTATALQQWDQLCNSFATRECSAKAQGQTAAAALHSTDETGIGRGKSKDLRAEVRRTSDRAISAGPFWGSPPPMPIIGGGRLETIHEHEELECRPEGFKSKGQKRRANKNKLLMLRSQSSSVASWSEGAGSPLSYLHRPVIPRSPAQGKSRFAIRG